MVVSVIDVAKGLAGSCQIAASGLPPTEAGAMKISLSVGGGVAPSGEKVKIQSGLVTVLKRVLPAKVESLKIRIPY